MRVAAVLKAGMALEFIPEPLKEKVPWICLEAVAADIRDALRAAGER